MLSCRFFRLLLLLLLLPPRASASVSSSSSSSSSLSCLVIVSLRLHHQDSCKRSCKLRLTYKLERKTPHTCGVFAQDEGKTH